MRRGAKYGIVAFLCSASLLVGFVSGWWLRGPPRGTKQLLDILADMAPKPATDADWRAVAVDRSTTTVSGVELPVVAARNLRPALEADDNLSAHHIAVVNTRNGDDLKTTISSIKANNALEIDWHAPEVRKTLPPGPRTQPCSVPQGQRPREKGYEQYLIGAPPDRFGPTELMIGTPGGDTRLPWTRPSSLMSAYFFREYRYAACLERSNETHKIVGMAIIDIQKRELGGVVDLPPQVGRYAPLLIIDPKTDILLCFDLDVAWIVCVDLRPARLAAEAAEKQAPAPEKEEAVKP